MISISALSGWLFGIFGATGVYGFLGYCISQAFIFSLLSMKGKFRMEHFFRSWTQTIWDSIFSGLMVRFLYGTDNLLDVHYVLDVITNAKINVFLQVVLQHRTYLLKNSNLRTYLEEFMKALVYRFKIRLLFSQYKVQTFNCLREYLLGIPFAKFHLERSKKNRLHEQQHQ